MEKAQHYDLLEVIAKFMTERSLYVEIGVAGGDTFRRVAPHFARAIGIDIDPKLAEYITPYGEFLAMTSDEFFEKVAPTLPPIDLCFVDADHLWEHSYPDFLNAVTRVRPLSGLIALHDTYPPDETMIRGGCWTSWKTAVAIRDYPEAESVTIPGQFGLTLVRFCPNGQHLPWMK